MGHFAKTDRRKDPKRHPVGTLMPRRSSFRCNRLYGRHQQCSYRLGGRQLLFLSPAFPKFAAHWSQGQARRLLTVFLLPVAVRLLSRICAAWPDCHAAAGILNRSFSALLKDREHGPALRSRAPERMRDKLFARNSICFSLYLANQVFLSIFPKHVTARPSCFPISNGLYPILVT